MVVFQRVGVFTISVLQYTINDFEKKDNSHIMMKALFRKHILKLSFTIHIELYPKSKVENKK